MRCCGWWSVFWGRQARSLPRSWTCFYIFRTEEDCMADLLFIVVTIFAFAVLIAFAYACDRR